MGIVQGPASVLFALFGVSVVAAALGFLRDLRRGRREQLLAGDASRARATVDYHVHVQDSGNA